MSDIKLESVMKSQIGGKSYDFLVTDYNKRKTIDLMPQPRRPQKLSKAYAFKLAAGVIEENK